MEYHKDELSDPSHPPAPLCLIVSPTRELALQTEREARKFAYQTGVIPCMLDRKKTNLSVYLIID